MNSTEPLAQSAELAARMCVFVTPPGTRISYMFGDFVAEGGR